MTEYTGEEVPLGHEKVVDFVTKVNGVPTEANAAEIEWRQPNGSPIETDALSGGGVYRPVGSTAENDPGHYRAKRLVDPAESIGPGYTAYLRWKESAGASFTPWALLETYEVVASDRTASLGATTLCTAQDVKDRLKEIPGLTLPTGLSDGRLLAIIDENNASTLARFGVTGIGYLTAQQQLVGRGACIRLTIADLLTAFFPMSDAAVEIAKENRKRAWEDIDQAVGGPQATPAKRKPFMRGV